MKRPAAGRPSAGQPVAGTQGGVVARPWPGLSDANIIILWNPRSGRGRAPVVADRIADALAPLAGGLSRHALLDGFDAAPHVDRADAVVVVGGDGAVHRLLPALERRRTPVLHAPTGTENLFAREFRTRPDPEHIVKILRTGVTSVFDLGDCNGRRFAIMASVGFDAGVIHRLQTARRGAITHATYVPHILGEALRPNLPRLTIRTARGAIVEARRGIAIVANSRQYAMRLDPAPRARIDDGLVDLVFIPAATTIGVMRAAATLRLRTPLFHRGILRAVADRFEISTDDPALCQMDGELARIVPPFEISCRHHAAAGIRASA